MSTKKWRHEPALALTPEFDPPVPGTPEWHRLVTASKVPALVGLSKWDTPYSLWAKATGRTEGRPVKTEVTERGDAIEPALLRWLEFKLTELGETVRVRPGATFAMPGRLSWQATPDGLVYEGKRRTPCALVECKTAANGGEWGTPGTAEIPPAYLAQCAWQMHVTGLRTVYVPALVNPGIRLNLWVVRWQDVEDTVGDLREAVTQWEDDVATDTPPALDGSAVTWETVREMSPDIDPDGSVVLDAWEAAELVEARAAKKAAEERLNLAQSVVVTAAAGARTILDPTGDVLARLSARKTKTGEYGKPFLQFT